jgi:hypothetical protein
MSFHNDNGTLRGENDCRCCTSNFRSCRSFASAPRTVSPSPSAQSWCGCGCGRWLSLAVIMAEMPPLRICSARDTSCLLQNLSFMRPRPLSARCFFFLVRYCSCCGPAGRREVNKVVVDEPPLRTLPAYAIIKKHTAKDNQTVSFVDKLRMRRFVTFGGLRTCASTSYGHGCGLISQRVSKSRMELAFLSP